MKKLLLILVLAGLLAAGWFTWQKIAEDSSRQGPSAPRTAEVSRRTIQRSVSATGFVEPMTSVEVKSEISGRIASINVKEGEKVTRGQTLATLDTTTLRSDLTEAQRTYQAYTLRLEKARRDFERLAGLREKNYAQESLYLDAQTDLLLAEIEVEVRQARLEKAQEDLDKATILAPLDGVVTDLNITEGQVVVGATSVNQGTTLMRVHDLDKLLVKTSVNEIDIEGIQIDTPVHISFDSLPGLHFDGKVSEIAAFAVNENNLRMFPIKISFDSKGHFIRAGISANVDIPVESAENVLALVLSAVFSEGNKRFVYLHKGEMDYEKRTITTGINNIHHVQITSGLEEGDVVRLTRPRDVLQQQASASANTPPRRG